MRHLLDISRRRDVELPAVKFVAGQIDMLEQVLALPRTILKGVGEGHNGQTLDFQEGETDFT